MLQIDNQSPFSPAINVFPNAQGVDTLYVTLKATFELLPQLRVAEEQLPPVVTDQFWGEPTASSVRYGSDIGLGKPSTDVVMISRAWPAPGQGAVRQLDVRFAVAERQKVLRVSGNRVWRDGLPSDPEPFESMPIVYEYAYGGTHPHGDEVLGEGANPVGRGFRGKRGRSEMEGLPLPNVEDPACLMSDIYSSAVPAGFAFVAPSWLPRREFAGTYDAAWQEQRAPYLPRDFDPRFFNAAHPDFSFDRYLQGGETVELLNLSRHGALSFALPACRLAAWVRIAGRVETPPLALETVLIEPEENRLCMTWGGSLACDKQALKVEQVAFELLEMQGAAA